MSESNGFVERLQTISEMLVAVLVLTIVSIGIGVGLVYLYKYLKLDDGFAQGSGSLVQAIWGSAATIAASVLAIVLATEALRMARKANELTKTSIDQGAVANKFQETESEPYAVWLKLQAALLTIDQYSLTVQKILNSTRGLVAMNNRFPFEAITYAVLGRLVDVFNSPAYHMLNQVESVGRDDLRNIQTPAQLLEEFVISMYGYKERLASIGLPEAELEFHNSVGRSIWSHLYDIRCSLGLIELKDMQGFMDVDIGVKWVNEKRSGAGFVYLSKPSRDYAESLKSLRDLLARRKPKSMPSLIGGILF